MEGDGMINWYASFTVAFLAFMVFAGSCTAAREKTRRECLRYAADQGQSLLVCQ